MAMLERARRGGAAILIAVATAAAGQDTPPVPPQFAEVPNVRVEYYTVSGTSPAAIRKSMNAVRPADSKGERFDAITRWTVRWRFVKRTLPNGECSPSDAQVAFAATVTLPRLVDSDAPAEVRARWRRYVEALETHEAGHASRAWARVPDITSALLDSSCEAANDTARAIVKQMNKADIAYDSETRHGATQGATFP